MDISAKYPKVELIQVKLGFGKTRYNLSHILIINDYILFNPFKHSTLKIKGLG